MQRRSHVALERRQDLRGYHRVCSTNPRPFGEGDTWGDPVIDDQTTTPPGDPDLGDRYIVPCGATGVWADHVGDIAEWVGNKWVFKIPTPGETVWVIARNRFTTLVATNMLEGPTTVATAEFWLPHHIIDESHTIFPRLVISATNTPPSFPGLYAHYRVTATATGVWAGQENKLAVSVCDRLTMARIWAFIPPVEGMLIWDATDNDYWYFDGTVWKLFELPHHLNDHLDTNFPNPVDGAVITWDEGTGYFIAVPPASAPVGDHTLGVPHSNVDDGVDSAPVGYVLTVVGSPGQWAAAPLPAPGDPEYPDLTIDDIGGLDAVLDDLQDQIDTIDGGGGGGGSSVILGVVEWDSGPQVYSSSPPGAFTVSATSGLTIMFTGGSKTVAWGVSDDNQNRFKVLPASNTWVPDFSSTPGWFAFVAM